MNVPIGTPFIPNVPISICERDIFNIIPVHIEKTGKSTLPYACRTVFVSARSASGKTDADNSVRSGAAVHALSLFLKIRDKIG